MITVSRYNREMEREWNEFVGRSRNATFMHNRQYMDYHSDRFADHSLVMTDHKGRLAALMPANERDGELFSHGGLTFGGLLMGTTGAVECMEMMGALTTYMKKKGLGVLHYKQIPTIYHRLPSQDDEYALWRHGATIEVCNMATTIDLAAPVTTERRRRRGVKSALEEGYTVDFNATIAELWGIIESNLMTRYAARPVHTLSEMELLAGRFPDNIRCAVGRNSRGEVEGGVVMYIGNGVVHAQYGHASATGYDHHVMDLVYTEVIKRARMDGYRYFDFGTSNEQGGTVLNPSLVSLKEGFGGHGVAYKQWCLSL